METCKKMLENVSLPKTMQMFGESGKNRRHEITQKKMCTQNKNKKQAYWLNL